MMVLLFSGVIFAYMGALAPLLVCDVFLNVFSAFRLNQLILNIFPSLTNK